MCEFTQGVSVPCTVVELGEVQTDELGLPQIPPETLLGDAKYLASEYPQGIAPLHLQVLNDRDWESVDRHVISSMYKQYVGHKMADLINYRAAQIEKALREKYGLGEADRSAVLEAAALHYKLPLIDVPSGGETPSIDFGKILGK